MKPHDVLMKNKSVHQLQKSIIPHWGLGPFVRDEKAPLLGANPTSSFHCPIWGKSIHWEDKDLLCAASVVKDGKVYLFYRAEDKAGSEPPQHLWGTSRIGLAVSEDGRTFKRHPQPVLYPQDDFMKEYEWPGGCQDPRVMQDEEGTFYMTYTSWDGKLARLSMATSKDLYHWIKQGLTIGTCKGGKYKDVWSKSGAIICRKEGEHFIATKIQGKYWMYLGDEGIYAATSDNLLDWNVIEGPFGKPLMVLPNRLGMVDSHVTEPGPPPFLTENGILMLYNAGAKDRNDLGLKGICWSVAQALLNPQDPTRVLERMDEDFFHPEKDFEINNRTKTGNSNVTFVEGLSWFKGEWRFYYGCADSYVAQAFYKVRISNEE